MLLPESPSGKRGQAVNVIYQWGHPFEHQLFHAPTPERIIMVDPDGKRIDLTDKVEIISTAKQNQQPKRFRIRFTPESRGDHLLFLRTPPIWMEEERHFLKD